MKLILSSHKRVAPGTVQLITGAIGRWEITGRTRKASLFPSAIFSLPTV